MLFTYYSNRLEALATQLIAVFDQPVTGTSPLQPLTVLVQSSGMARWLSLQFARQSGVAANVQYPFLASFVWEVYRAQRPTLPRESVSDKPVLLWRLLALFERDDFLSQFPELAAYLGAGQPMLKRYQLAGMVADVFDQYLIYRPDWMLDWESDRHQHWQARLWRRLAQAAPENDPHRSRVHQDVLSRAGRMDVSQLPARLAIIGISSIPPAYLDLLAALAQKVDIHVFVLNPSLHYWGDIATPKRQARALAQFGVTAEDIAQRSHPLLASMGRQGQEFIDLLQQYPADETAVFVDPAAQRHTLLSVLQHDVLLLQQPKGRATDGGAEYGNSATVAIDKSVQFASCHSIVRELEVLHDMLLDYFDRQPQAKPDDVVVMVPAIDDYAPYIQAVFGAQPPERRLPFTVSDRAPTAADALLACFLQLLDLPEQRFAHSAVVDVLRNPAVQRRYQIAEFDALLDMIERSQIRWGLDEHDWQQAGIDTRQNTWAFGLDRLFAGYVYGDKGNGSSATAGAVVLGQQTPDQPTLDQQIMPLYVSGSNAVQDIGALSCFVRDLHTLLLLRHDRTAAQWMQHISALLDRFFAADDFESVSVNRIRSAVQVLQHQTELAAFDSNISYAVVRDYLEQALDSKSQGQQYFNGAITFCTLMPMRSLPFAVVCMLGLNDATFPRRQSPCSFDLIAAQPRKGDRNRRYEDRYLFLEAVLAAREQIYISYIGHSIIDNSPREPSVLVSELLDVLAQYPGIQRDKLVSQHPLQPFDVRYFSPDNDSSVPGSQLFSYAVDWVAAARNYQLPLALKKPFDFSAGDFSATAPVPPHPIELDNLLAWAAHPSRYLLRNCLGIDLARQDDQLFDDEHFEVDGLMQYQLAHDGAKAVMEQGTDFEVLLQQWTYAGLLPVGAVGRAAVATLQNTLSPFVQSAATAGRFTERQSIDINIGDFQIIGCIRQLGAGGRFDARYSTLKGKSLLSTWLQHLLLNAAGHSTVTQLLLRDALVTLAPVPIVDAMARLGNVLDVYRRSVDVLQPVFVDLSYRIAERENKGDVHDKLLAEIEKFYAVGENAKGIYSDEHDSYLFGSGTVPEAETFIAIAQQLFGGMFEYMQREALASDVQQGNDVQQDRAVAG